MDDLHFSALELVQALLHHKHTLEALTVHLYLSVEIQKRVPFDHAPEESYIGTALREFTNLKRLTCEMGSLLGLNPTEPDSIFEEPDLVDTLPESLEEMDSRCADARIIDHLKRLGEVKSQRFPNLRKVNASISGGLGTNSGVELQIDGVEVTVEMRN